MTVRAMRMTTEAAIGVKTMNRSVSCSSVGVIVMRLGENGQRIDAKRFENETRIVVKPSASGRRQDEKLHESGRKPGASGGAKRKRSGARPHASGTSGGVSASARLGRTGEIGSRLKIAVGTGVTSSAGLVEC